MIFYLPTKCGDEFSSVAPTTLKTGIIHNLMSQKLKMHTIGSVFQNDHIGRIFR